VVLLLDGSLNALPWESAPCLSGQPVSRAPFVEHIFRGAARSAGGDSPIEADARRGVYCLNPSGTLPGSEKRLLERVFGPLERRFGWRRVARERGNVGNVSAPETDALAAAVEGASVYAFCGHGAGERWLPPERVLDLARCPTTLLMGCSSGALRADGELGVDGTALRYLAAGAPAAAAALWDVTDRDIDRFSQDLLRRWLPSRRPEKARRRSEPSSADGEFGICLAEAVAAARSVCRLRFAVGAAVCVYGLPVVCRASDATASEGGAAAGPAARGGGARTRAAGPARPRSAPRARPGGRGARRGTRAREKKQ
jgi:separase